ncbi:hypothetical protein D918_00587 [Trichuris suis]|nr:hypothetical protein D918_00587 [Trichuris suis]
MSHRHAIDTRTDCPKTSTQRAICLAIRLGRRVDWMMRLFSRRRVFDGHAAKSTVAIDAGCAMDTRAALPLHLSAEIQPSQATTTAVDRKNNKIE